MEILADVILFFLGGFLAVVICSKYDSWQRYRKKIGKGAYKAVYEKVLDIEHNYRMEGDVENTIDCVRLQNLMNYFKDEICSEN